MGPAIAAIESHALRKAFGAVVALDGVSVTIAPGEFYGLLGPNGAGKTTFLRIVCGLLRSDSGDLRILGQPLHEHRHPVLGVVPQEIALYEVLTARANLQIFGELAGLFGAELTRRIDHVLEQVGLSDRAKARVKTFSGGMKRRLNLAVGLLADPPILLFDEPTVGVDPQSRARIFTLLQKLHAAGKTIIYTTHYMEEAERLCRRIGIIDHGKMLAEGTLSELLAMVDMPRTVRVHGLAAETPPEVTGTQMQRETSYVEYVPKDPRTVTTVVDTIQQSGAVYNRLEITGPSLETLFLQLTGKELRD